MSKLKDEAEPLRYERKFLITDYTPSDVEQFIKFHPFRFTEIFHQRQINNIYFDTLGFGHYYDNVEGSPDRLKVRIRWYGNLFGPVSHPVLEYKIKKGLLGKKDSYSLAPFVLDEHFSQLEIEKALTNPQTPAHVKAEVLSLKPVLLNSYVRKYFQSADKNFRVTIDHQLTYYRIAYSGNTFVSKSVDHQATVLELKYDSSMEEEAKKLGSLLPFPMTKNSKYLQGLERLFL